MSFFVLENGVENGVDVTPCSLSSLLASSMALWELHASRLYHTTHSTTKRLTADLSCRVCVNVSCAPGHWEHNTPEPHYTTTPLALMMTLWVIRISPWHGHALYVLYGYLFSVYCIEDR